jgi:SlyX protein
MTHHDPYEGRFLALETRVAYQEREIAELNGVVFQHQRTIDVLQAHLLKTSAQLRELGIAGDDSPNQKPPHY